MNAVVDDAVGEVEESAVAGTDLCGTKESRESVGRTEFVVLPNEERQRQGEPAELANLYARRSEGDPNIGQRTFEVCAVIAESYAASELVASFYLKLEFASRGEAEQPALHEAASHEFESRDVDCRSVER